MRLPHIPTGFLHQYSTTLTFNLPTFNLPTFQPSTFQPSTFNLAMSDFDPPLRDMLVRELIHVPYRRCLTVTLAYNRPIERPFYALVNVDRQHPMAWLALELSIRS
jgi:hypothetical protein